MYELNVFLGSLLVGWVLFFVILRFLPHLEKKSSLLQRQEALKEATKQGESIKAAALLKDQEHELLWIEEQETFDQQQKADLQIQELELSTRESSCELEEKRVQKFETAVQMKSQKVLDLTKKLAEKRQEKDLSQINLIESLEKRCNLDAKKLAQNIELNFVEEQRIEHQKILKSLQEDVSSSSRKLAQRALERVHSRYSPDFVWPKASNVVEIMNAQTFTQLSVENCRLIEDLKELAEINIQVIAHEDSSSHPDASKGLVKVAGGFGIYREAARLALDEMIQGPTSQWAQVRKAYTKHKQALEWRAVELGKKAITILNLPDVHPEIQKLVGALNWRTSYRQNQWHHTVEVAVLAGVIASEMGVDPNDAKRVGMLHDIGKAIDYRIDGSHAVISGDYADRYGEKRFICDTVMSHHADLLVETPLAYVLRAADTLSGARPGARVNLEEGYQIRLSAIYEIVSSFHGILDVAIMNGGREVHIQVNNKKIHENDVAKLAKDIAQKISEGVAFPGQIKVLVTRSFESVTVA